MMAISTRSMLAFVDELHKTAGWLDQASDFARRNLAGRYGRQLALGAGLGAAGNIGRHALSGDLDQQSGGVLGAGLRGAAAGGAVAGGRILATSEGRRRARQAASDFYDRELYGLTGKARGGTPMDAHRAEALGIISPAPMRPRVKLPLPDASGPVQPALTAKGEKSFARQMKRHEASKELFEKGWASAPGGLHGVLHHPLDYAKLKWQSLDPVGKGFLGLGAAGAVHGMVKTPSEEDPNKYKRGLGQLAGAVGGVLAPGAGWIGQGLMAGGIANVGKGVGTAVDYGARRLGRVVPHEEQAQWQPMQ